MSVAGLAVLVAAVGVLLRKGEPAGLVPPAGLMPGVEDPRVAIAVPAPASLTAAAKERGVKLPAELALRYPARTRVDFSTPMDPRDFGAGIACPGGGFLPLLNGVPFAQALHRNTALFGPVPLVVGKYVDEEGNDWYVHADGSETTTRWTQMQVEGVARRDVRTDHTVPTREEHGLSTGDSSKR